MIFPFLHNFLAFIKKTAKTGICSIIVLSIPVIANAQIKSYVGIVREHYYPSLVQFMEDYRDSLKDDGYTTYAKYVDAYLKGGFGSGFVYVSPDGKNYIITNRHVVAQAGSASIEFEDSDTGKINKYDGLTVLATDDDIDVAILAFPEEERPFKTGLTFSTEVIHDGDDVWSAGYPGLGTDPIWQLGKGNITNAKVRINDLLDSGISTLIQHSAQADAGNSGGPLMIVSKKDPAGYAVIGINTWKATYREATNYAIPSQVIINFINRSTKPRIEQNDEETVKNRAATFTALLQQENADFTAIVKYISYNFTSITGKEDFVAVLRFAPTKIRNIVLDTFTDDPFEGLRYATAYKIWKQYHQTDLDLKAYSAETITNKGCNYTVEISDSKTGKKIITEWAEEQGLWRITNSDMPNASKKRKNVKSKKTNAGFIVTTPSITRPYFFSLQAGGIFAVAGNVKSNSFRDTTISYTPQHAVNIQADFVFGTRGLWGIGSFFNFENINSVLTKSAGIDATLRLPLDFTAFSIIPYAQSGLGLCWTGASPDGMNVYIEGGLLCVLDTGRAAKPGIGIAYNSQSIRLEQINYQKYSIKTYALLVF
jgi:serine protease Do